MPGCESRSLSDSRSTMRGSPAANASSTFGRRRGPTSLRSHHGGRRAQTGPGSSTDATKTREPSRSWRRTRNSPRHPRDRRGQIRRLDTRPDHRRYAHTARHRQSSGGLHQHRQDPLIMPDLERGSRSTAIRRNKRRTAGRRAVIYDSSTAPVTDLAAARIRRARSSAGLSTSTNGQHDGHRPRHNIAGQRLRQGIGNLQPGRHAACMSPAWPRSPARAVAAPPASSLLPRCADASAPAYDQLTRVRVRRRTFPSRRRQRRLRG